MTARLSHIARLRAKIEALEKRPALADQRLPVSGIKALIGGLPGGLLHEVWADTPVHAGAALGFALGQAQGLAGSARPALIWLSLGHDAQETGLPYGAGLTAFGFDPDRLVIGRMKDMGDLLWAAEEALACPAVAAVIAETGRGHKALDFTATRRLGLRTNSSGASLFLMRTGTEREATAAPLRWHIAPATSAAAAFDARAPGRPRFAVRLEKGQGIRGRTTWVLDWTEHGFTDAEQSGTGRQTGRTALSGASSAALGDRLSQTA